MNKSMDLLLGNGAHPVTIHSTMANRHGLIAGATGTGKTVTLRTMAEGFSHMGVPVFMADMKGDLSGLAKAGGDNPKVAQRVQQLAIEDFSYQGFPVVMWDVFGERGHPVRTTISEMGPLLLARLLNLNDTQSSVLSLVFKIADDHGLLLLDMKDLRSMVQHVSENRANFQTEYGNLSSASLGAIQRNLISLEEQGGNQFFGEPALNLEDFIQTDAKGNGVINILAAEKLSQSPTLYGSFLLWMLSELFEALPEVGDMDKPKLVFFFDEAHLLFADASKVLLTKIEQVVRLIRSKGVGIYFVTQNPLDLPESILGQLGNRVQHALRAFTPRDQKAVKTAAQTFRANPKLNTEQIITELGVGEALVSVLDDKGAPTQVERVMIAPPRSRLQPLSDQEQQTLLINSVLYNVYEKAIDRESAYEQLKTRASDATQEMPQTTKRATDKKQASSASDLLGAFAKSAARAVGSQLGRQVMRGLLGSLLGSGTSTRRRRY